MTRRPTNLAASIRQRLLDRSRTRGEDHQILLVRYALERLLARLAASPSGSTVVWSMSGSAMRFIPDPNW